jgi:hypothetical protein
MRQDIVDWLSDFNFKVTQRDVFAQWTDGTGQWLFDSNEFKTWLAGQSKTLWCHGMREMSSLKAVSFLTLLLGSWCWKNCLFVSHHFIHRYKGDHAHQVSCRKIPP